LIESFGTISENSLSMLFFVLHSANLKESVPTNSNLDQSSSFFDLIKTQVRTGLKFFSVTAYSTFSIHCANV
jgi:hypothetical protein